MLAHSVLGNCTNSSTSKLNQFIIVMRAKSSTRCVNFLPMCLCIVLHIYAHTLSKTRLITHTRTHTGKYTYTHTDSHTYKHTHTHTQTHTHMHTHTRTHITHTNTQTHILPWPFKNLHKRTHLALAFISDMIFSYVTWRIYMWHGFFRVIHTWHDSSICDMTYSYVTWIIYMWRD